MSEIPPPTVPPATPPPPPPPPAGPGGASSDRTLMVVLAYLGILSLIPYFVKKDDPDTELRWHAKNGLGLFLADIVIWVVFFVLQMVLRNSVMGCGMATINCVVWLAVLAVHIYCLIQAVNGKRVRIPVVTDFAEKTL